jgi:chromosomal replication initiator protein
LELRSQPELTPAWHDVRAGLRSAVGDSTYQIWLEPLQACGWDGSVLIVATPPETQCWVSERFGRIVQRCVQSVFGPTARVTFTSDAAVRSPHPINAAGRASGPEILSSFNPRYSFEQFVMGDANRLAHGAALAAAESPGQSFNPLFLYGPPGLGKTHLLHAIGNYLAVYSPDTVVRYTTVEAFTNGFINALGSRSVERFKHLYRDVDVLLIDDVQFLASKARTEEEFFHTFNAVYESGRQLVLTCDRLPSQLVAVEERLRDRFQSGLVAELSVPDHATRVAILRKRASLDGVAFADPRVLDLLAARICENIRSLEGALIRLVAVHSLTRRPLDLTLARAVLDEIQPVAGSNTQMTVGQIQEAVAGYFALSTAELCSSTRAAKVAWPRQLAIQLARDLTALSLQAIGEAFGGRNHATALHACRRVAERVAHDPEAAEEFAAVRRALATWTGQNDRRN